MRDSILPDGFIHLFLGDQPCLPVAGHLLADHIKLAPEFEHEQLLVYRSQFLVSELVDLLMQQRAQLLRRWSRGGAHDVKLPHA